MDFESETFVAQTVTADMYRSGGAVAGNNDQGVRNCFVVPILEAGARTGASTTDPRAGIGIGEQGDPMYTLQSGKQHAIEFQSSQSGVREVDAHATLDSNNGSRRHNGVVQHMAVRRLTPEECEALQGFERGYTQIPRGRKGVPTADGPRYKALGNSWAVPCVRWIFDRMQVVDGMLKL